MNEELRIKGRKPWPDLEEANDDDGNPQEDVTTRSLRGPDDGLRG